MICKLLKTLHSLKQLPWLWYKKLLNFLFPKFGLLQINANYSIIITKVGLDGPDQ